MKKKRKQNPSKYTDREILAARRRDLHRMAADIDRIRVSQNVSALEAALIFADMHQLEPEEVAAAIRQNVRVKTILAKDAMALRLLKTSE